MGVTNVDFGFEVMDAVTVKIIEYTRFKIVEFRKRDFKFGIGITHEDTYPLSANGMFEYEIYANTKNNRLRTIIDTFINIFNGTTIKFHFSEDKYELNFSNGIESLKFGLLKDILKSYENVVEELKLYKYKNLSGLENQFYDVEIMYKSLKNKEEDSWINGKIKTRKDLKVGDILTLRKVYKMNFSKQSFDVEELIELKNPLTEANFKDGYVDINKRRVKLRYNKI